MKKQVNKHDSKCSHNKQVINYDLITKLGYFSCKDCGVRLTNDMKMEFKPNPEYKNENRFE